MTDRLDELDYYTLLGIGDDADARAIRAAFQRFALRYHPDRHIGGRPEDRERAAQIFRRGSEAYRALLCPEARRVYDAGLRRGELRLAPGAVQRASTIPPASASSIDSPIPKARAFFSTAMEAVAKGDFAKARLNLKVALAHDPGNAAIGRKLAELEARAKARVRASG